MSIRDFSAPDVRERVAKAVGDLEARTAAEIVVAVRPSSGHYRHADYAFGALCGLGATLLFVFHPAPFRSDLFPLELAVAFALGALVSARVPVLRRALSGRALRRTNVERAARSTFVELGVSRTKGRTGVLVYASMLEHDAEVVADHGIELGEQAAEWQRAADAIREAIRRADADGFVAALGRLGTVLERVAPRAHDDRDELSNELRVA